MGQYLAAWGRKYKFEALCHGKGERIRSTQINTCGLKSKLSAPPVAEYRAFEDEVARLIENVKFRDVNNEFMKEIELDRRKMKSSTNIFVPADKTRTKCIQVITRNCSRKMSLNPTNKHRNTLPQISQNNSRTWSTNCNYLIVLPFG